MLSLFENTITSVTLIPTSSHQDQQLLLGDDCGVIHLLTLSSQDLKAESEEGVTRNSPRLPQIVKKSAKMLTRWGVR